MNYNKIIGILSEDSDSSTNVVISYLKKGNCYIHRFNIEQLFYFISNNSINFYSIWLRRQNFIIYGSYFDNLHHESCVLNYFYHFRCESFTRVLGSVAKDYNHNKLIDLDIAKKFGIEIPNTYIISSKKQIVNLFSESKNKKFITKALYNHRVIEIDNQKFSGGFTSEIRIMDIKNIQVDFFFPSLIQEYVEKIIEIRSFYLCGYSV